MPPGSLSTLAVTKPGPRMASTAASLYQTRRSPNRRGLWGQVVRRSCPVCFVICPVFLDSDLYMGFPGVHTEFINRHCVSTSEPETAGARPFRRRQNRLDIVRALHEG